MNKSSSSLLTQFMTLKSRSRPISLVQTPKSWSKFPTKYKQTFQNNRRFLFLRKTNKSLMHWQCYRAKQGPMIKKRPLLRFESWRSQYRSSWTTVIKSEKHSSSNTVIESVTCIVSTPLKSPLYMRCYTVCRESSSRDNRNSII